MSAIVFLDVALLVVLLGLTGLVTVAYMRLRAFSKTAGQMPALNDNFISALGDARTAVAQLSGAAKKDGIALEEQVYRAERTIQELTYLLDRADKVLTQLDETATQHPVTRPQAPRQQPASRPVDTPQAPQKTAGSTNRDVTPPKEAVVMRGRQQPERQPRQQEAQAAATSGRQGFAGAYAAAQARQNGVAPSQPKEKERADDVQDSFVPQRTQASEAEMALRRALEETL